jgi:hypothetical protein
MDTNRRTSPPRARRLLIAAASALLAGLVYLSFSARAGRTAAEPHATDVTPAMSSAPTRAERSAEPRSAGPRSAPALVDEGSRPAEPAHEEPPGETPPPVKAADVHDSLESVWTSQTSRSAWAGDASRTAASKLRALLPDGSATRSIECRDSMCRIETEHADAARYSKFVRSAFLDGTTQLWNGGFFSSIVEDASGSGGKLVSVAYLAPEGQTLPLHDGP